jgi:hypothetical protein
MAYGDDEYERIRRRDDFNRIERLSAELTAKNAEIEGLRKRIESMHNTNLLMDSNNRLRSALSDLLERYVDLVNCGDCGNWDPEGEGEVQQARAALHLIGAQPYLVKASECGHAGARVICPDCGIDLRGLIRTRVTEKDPVDPEKAHPVFEQKESSK